MSSRTLPPRPSLEQLRNQAKDLQRQARAGEADAVARLAAIDASDNATADPGGEATGGVSRNAAPAASARAGDARLTRAQALHVIAREHGFASWPRLVEHVESLTGGDGAGARAPLIRPVELRAGLPYRLPDGAMVTTDDVFGMFVAARAGDQRAVKRAIARAPGLATVEYNYTPPIHFAVREGHLPLVELLLARGADPAYRSYPFQESLLTFAEDRGHAEIADLLRRALSRRFALSSQAEALIAAATAGDETTVASLLEREPLLARVSNETGDTALHQAAHRGHLAIARRLLDAGAAVDAVRGDGYRPLHCALMPHWFFVPPDPPVISLPSGRETTLSEREGARVGAPRAAIVDLLLARGARHTIFTAALRGEADTVRDMIARDPTLANFEDTCHHRVLSAVVRRRDVELTRLLLAHGADPRLPEEGAPGGLSLWIAVNDRQVDIVTQLLAHGADPNAPVESSGTAMLQARRDPALTALLRAHGGRPLSSPRDQLAEAIDAGRLEEVERLVRAHPEWLDDATGPGWGDGILAGPANDGNHDVLALLIRLGARVPLVSKWAPYYYFKHEATAAFLLAHGMDANHMNWHRFTLLHHMAAEGEAGKATLLLDHGAAIDAIDEEYLSTPLGVAVRRGQQTLVELLLARGADPTASGAPWATPLAWARAKERTSIERILIAALERQSADRGE